MANTMVLDRTNQLSVNGQVRTSSHELTVTDPRRQTGTWSVPLATDTLFNITLDVSHLKYYRLKASTAVTIETNATDATGGNTIVLPAGLVVEWSVNDPHAKLFTLDVTKFYISAAAISELEFDFVEDASV